MTSSPRKPQPLHLEIPVETPEVDLPILRAEIRLLQAPRDPSGNPTWTLHDPVRARFYRIGWLEFELLSRWSCRKASTLISSINQETTLDAQQHHVDALLRMLKENELLVCDHKEKTTTLNTNLLKGNQSIPNRVFMLSLFARRKLLNPEKILGRLNDSLSPIYRHQGIVVLLLILVALVGLWALVQHQFELKSTLIDYLSPHGFIGFIVALVFLNIIHEFGHGLAACRQGCRTTDMGVAFIFMIPVAYCDTSDAWKLDSHRKRLWVDAGGLIIEALVAVLAAWCWILLPDGLLRTLAFFVAVTSLGTTLFINLNPFMKFDGYFLLADFLGIENLQERAFATLRWRIRQWTLGSTEPMPFNMSARRSKTVQIYAAGTWIYRFFLYLGITWMVYQFWFKAAGVLMMIAVFGIMILRPICIELIEMSRVIKAQGIHRRAVLSASIFVLLSTLLVAPLPRLITTPAVLTSADNTQSFSPRPARVAELHIHHGQMVNQGDIIAILESPELQNELAVRKNYLELLHARFRQQASMPTQNSEQWVDQHDIDQAHVAILEIQQEIDKLILRSQSTGHIVRLDNWIQPGIWLSENVVVAEIASHGSTVVRTYIPERDVRRIQATADHSAPTFFPNKHGKAHPLTITDMSQDNIGSLRDASLTIANGGSIAARLHNQDQWTTLQGWHSATLTPIDNIVVNREQTGWVRFQAEPVSLASRGFDRLYGALLRELSF